MANPLQNSWVLWEHKVIGGKEDWETSMRSICEFATVEDFWRYWSFMPRPSEVFYDGQTRKEIQPDGRTIDAFSMFKHGIKPAWEDPANKKGGELLCRKTMTVDALDTYWENLVLGLIGETVDEQDEICGCRVVDKSKKGNRMMFRLEIWTRTGNAELAEKMKQRLGDVLVEGDSKGGNKLKPLDFEFKSSHS